MKDWVKNVVIFALAVIVVYGFFTIRQAQEAIGLLRYQTQQMNDALQGQCEVALDRMGYNVQLTPKPTTPPLPNEEPEKE
jgi:hypothetical protein